MSDVDELISNRGAAVLTVAQLIERLSVIEDQSQPVWAHGCDCSNPVIDVIVERGGVALAVDA